MLQKILSISGKPGLYKLVSQGRNSVIVESLLTGKRMPSYAHERLMSLGDIAIFTTGEDKPLREVLLAMQEKEQGNKASVDPKADPDTLRDYLAGVLPDFDPERVYPTDIRKMVSWYNLLTETGHADFSPEPETAEAEK